MIRACLDDVLKGKLIKCVCEDSPSLSNEPGESATYSLRWCNGHFTTTHDGVDGFFGADGNRTDIPIELFFAVIPDKPLSVIKVVDSIIPLRIGFQTRHGRSRQQVAISFQHIQNYARTGSRFDLAKGARNTPEKNHIISVVEGVFSHRYAVRRSASYALSCSDSVLPRCQSG